MGLTTPPRIKNIVTKSRDVRTGPDLPRTTLQGYNSWFMEKDMRILEVKIWKKFQFCVSVHHIMINKNTSLKQLISIYFTYSKSLHVSGRTLLIIRRI